MATPAHALPAIARNARTANGLRHAAIAVGLALLWSGANVLGWTIGHATTDTAQTFAHFAYGALLTMLMLAATIAIADAHANGDEDAVAPYAIAAITAALGGEILFSATAPWLGVAACACAMDRWEPGARSANMLPDSLLICGFVTAGYRYWRRSSTRLAKLNARELARAQVERRALESRLQAMQACIEPQFLFDTLASAERLHAEGSPDAPRLIDELIIYLRSALPHLRESSSTVAKESELVHAWINIQRFANGRGPAFEMDLRSDTGLASMPPMLLLPLVQYVLGDASEASAEGALRIDVRRASGRVRFEIAATDPRGRASAAAAGRLAGLRERLHTLYGTAARLTVGAGRAHPHLVILDIPHERADRDHR